MSYNLTLSKPIEQEVKEIFDSMLKQTILIISNQKINNDKKIHELRRTFKKIRAFLKLLKYDLQDKEVYYKEKEYYKNAAKRFSDTRDIVVLRNTFEKILKITHLATKDKKQIFNDLKSFDKTRLQGVSLEKEFEILQKEIEQKRKELDIYQLKNKKHPLRKALKKTSKKMFESKKTAYETEEDEHFHQWRKNVKNYMYKLELLKPHLSKKMKNEFKKLEKLANILGNEHDLSLLKEFLGLQGRDSLLKHLKEEQNQLRKKALKINIKGYIKQKFDFSEQSTA